MDRLASIVDPHHFVAHADQLFARYPSGIVLQDETSVPTLKHLLKALSATDSISLVRILPTRLEVPDRPTVCCQLVSKTGTWQIVAHWSCSKPERTTELISSLLAPLRAYDLTERTILCKNTSSFDVMPDDPAAQIQAILSMFGEPYSEVQHGSMEDLAIQSIPSIFPGC